VADCDLAFAPGAFWTFTDTREVELDGIRVAGTPDHRGLVRVYGAARLRVTNCVLWSRTPEGFTVPLRFFDGLDVLTGPWSLDDDRDVDRALFRTGIELSGLNDASRNELVTQLRDRLEPIAAQGSAGLAAAVEGLIDALRASARAAGTIAALDEIRYAATAIRPAIALEIGRRDDDDNAEVASHSSVQICDCLIPGIVSFYGRCDPDLTIAADVLRRLEVLVGTHASVAGHGGEVCLRDNRLTRLALGIALIRLLEDIAANPRSLRAVYQSFLLTNNVIGGVVSESVAQHTACTSNTFTLDALAGDDAPQLAPVVSHVVGDTAVYTGNHAVRFPDGVQAEIVNATRAVAQAANLELQIT
jgi:hypothetical protein